MAIGSASVSDTAYDATTWDGVTLLPRARTLCATRSGVVIGWRQRVQRHSVADRIGIWVSASSIKGTTGLTVDTNSNLTAKNLNSGYATTATAAGTTTLTVASKFQQYFTGTTTQTVVLPVTSTLVLGFRFFIANASSGAVTVNSSGGNLVVSLAAGTSALVTCILITGTTAASWSVLAQGAGGGDALVANPLSQFAATTSLQFKGVISDETGSGSGRYFDRQSIVTPVLGTPSSGTLTSCTGLPVSTGYQVWAPGLHGSGGERRFRGCAWSPDRHRHSDTGNKRHCLRCACQRCHGCCDRRCYHGRDSVESEC